MCFRTYIIVIASLNVEKLCEMLFFYLPVYMHQIEQIYEFPLQQLFSMR